LLDAGLDDKVEVVAAFDINTVANKVYKLNFGLEPTIVKIFYGRSSYFCLRPM
jgi:site-specific DNA-cytosine methylase